MSLGSKEDEIRKAADTKEWLESRLTELEAEISKLKDTLSVVDSVLRGGSFLTAAEIVPRQTSGKPLSQGGQVVAPEADEVRQLKSKGGDLLANAYITTRSVTIIPASEISLSSRTPPFNSFFVKKILEGMKSLDQEEVRNGTKSGGGAIDFQIDEDDNSNIVKITVENYGENSRLEEIINTSTWTFSRMLEQT
ncbi:MAG: hypothetical protein O7B30_04335 [Thaumarchaeota archaeon]|nr:hypothetical protein [Nitrososphaerota archaeon]